ncbi:MAG TPA: class D sortase [Abditibacterium sp.]|jgi:sortase A
MRRNQAKTQPNFFAPCLEAKRSKNELKSSPFQRGDIVLWLIFASGLALMARPLFQAASARWNQHVLRQAWNAEAQIAQAQRVQAPAMPVRRQLPPKIRVATGKPTAPAASRARWESTRLLIPAIGVDVMVVNGVEAADLKRGPGHDPLSALPGQRGNCVIAGHRNVYGAWFYRLNELGRGGQIELRTPRQTFKYHLASLRVLPDTATSVLLPPRRVGAAPRLTLYTCALPHGSRRIVATANLIESR